MNNFMKVAAVGLLTGYTACQAFVCPAGQHLSSAVCRGASSSSAATLSMVAKGDVVTVDLQVKDAKTGKPFESTFDQGQVRFVVGGGGFLPAIHKAVERMQVSLHAMAITATSSCWLQWWQYIAEHTAPPVLFQLDGMLRFNWIEHSRHIVS
eukprot:TRINITY_DN9797_c0_g1_i1.p1 TRINITY_DN9797_c0_g1~~TRINITY_DN9797_c0_g1_i1.p1  ORF type:complete len:152 (-),score=19.46 TRINITY_DN9797_c0_g1_i1:408-863(-)